MSRIRLYVDEDAMDSALIRGLRSRGLNVRSAADAQMIRRKDEHHLELASTEGRVLYSFNIGDFHEIHCEWMASGRTHAGLILAQQKRYSVGEQVRRIVKVDWVPYG